MSDPRAAAPEPTAADGYPPHADPPSDRSSAPRSAAREFSSPAYASGQDHRVMDRRTGPADWTGLPQDRPARGSLAELRLRLERLPAGHPSSPYDDRGARKPAPQQLRQLELPLADEERESEPPARASLLAATAGDRNGAPSGSRTPSGDEHSPRAAPPSSPDPAHGRNGTAQRATLPASDWMTGQNEAPHASPSPDSWPGGNGTGPSDGHGGDDPRRGNGARTHDTAPRPADTARRDGTDPYETGMPYDSRTAGDGAPSGRGPAEDAAADQAPAQYRSRLTPEQEKVADQALGRYRAADGRNVFGGYGESGLTPVMRRVEAHLPHGRLAPDIERYTLKSPERYKEKLARMIARSPGVPVEDLAAEIYDAARYTFIFEPENYTDGTWLVHRRLKAQGFELEARRNRWESPEYKGIRTRWRDPAHDLAFEVQFHTPASWDVLQRTHDAYLRITDPQTPPAGRAQLRARQVAAAAASRPPPRCGEIGDFRADVR